MYDDCCQKGAQPRLYVCKALIIDEFEDPVPPCPELVDATCSGSDTMRLNMPGVALQQHMTLKVVSKKPARKAL